MRHKVLAAGVVAVVAATAVSAQADGPPPPVGASGQKVTVVGHGVPTPTAFAFVGKQLFIGAFGGEDGGRGGVFVMKDGVAQRVPGTGKHVFGVASTGGKLYISEGAKIVAKGGWNGTSFTTSRIVVKGPKDFSGFNGIAVGPNHKLYAGVALGDGRKADHSAGTTPFANDVLRIDIHTGTIRVVATGLRQPWQPAFVPGHSGPLVSDLGQENLGDGLPNDFIVEATPGSNFGFPGCPASPTACASATQPYAQFPAHASPMGLASIGNTLYVALFGGTGMGPEVVSLPATGVDSSTIAPTTPVLTGFVAPVVALTAHAGRLYVGDLTGSIYSVTP